MFKQLFFVVLINLAAIHAAPSKYSESVLPDDENNHISDSDEFFYERGSNFEGDIVLTPLNFAGGNSPKWTNKQIPFIIDDAISSSEMNIISLAIAEIHSKTCIRLINRSSQQNYVRFVKPASGCSSYVGMIGGSQSISLAPGCYTKKTVVHEIIHAIGFWHEQSRSDRDDYVNINWSNIASDKQHNFNKHSNTISFGFPYEYESIMHYSAYAFASNWGIPTITSKTNFPIANFGKGDGNGGMTDTDAAQINRMYGC